VKTFLIPILLVTGLGPVACGQEGPGEGHGDTAASPGLPASLPSGAQARSLLGEPLYPPELSDELRVTRQDQLEEALQELDVDPSGADALIWVGRRYAYLGGYQKAIETFTRGIEAHPDDARFYRHRGHRFITVRRLDEAIADFERAARLIEGTEDVVEPDGQPNALGIPTSTLHFNIWYHYGLAHYLKGEFDQAIDKYQRCMAASVHPDSKIATAHWWYMSLRRAGRTEEAERLIRGLELDVLAPDVIESGAYLQLLRLYATGAREDAPLDAETLEGATEGYGIGNWELYNGDTVGALGIFQSIVEARDQWAAFGYIAAEAELARAGQI
jgi:tetratricopeptide (TPR) repeat protein